MLKSLPADEPETLSGETFSTASQTRVTPEELSQALTAIEARKQVEANRLAGTIPINQAVSELNLDSTPEEILVEVQAQRAQAASRHNIPVPAFHPPASLTRQAVQAGYAAYQKTRDSGRRVPRWTGVAVVGVVLFSIFSGHHHPSPRLHSAPVFETLTQVPENTPVYGDMATVQEIATGTPPAQVRVSLGNDVDNSWRLIKHGGQVYVQAYTLPVTEQAIKAGGKPFRLYNDDNAGQLKGEHYTDITLPLKSLHWDDSHSTDEGWGEITVSQVHPDSRIWENW